MEAKFKIRMVGCEWSYQIWETFYTYFNSQTRAQIKQLKKVVDTLAAIGAPLRIDEHFNGIVDGLPDEYGGFVTCIVLCLKKILTPSKKLRLY